MEHTALNMVRRKYLSRFIATFFAENRQATRSCKIDCSRAAYIIMSVIYLKSGYKPQKEDVYDVFNDLRYTIIGATTSVEKIYTTGSKIYLKVDAAQVEDLATLLKYLTAPMVSLSDRRIQELDLQINIFNKLHSTQITFSQ